ncbi:hypothetical protein AMATHDRAFT_159 [Amanita thiersii Skay4041]|uniref:Uncharacterized protein n=1 Tax=Amanita thiersii Skay4041 TaxID=703135 RepID=A0A2A9NUE4_9AGAR|nr:hypothetical protein AMATHDRAFT_159 [Amanita thiersii Skay4041]
MQVSPSLLKFPPNCSLQFVSVISDIPLCAVGLMAFSMLTFLVAVKKLSPIVCYLYAASFLVFGATIFNLSKILVQVEDGRHSNHAARALDIIHELGSALSFGLVFVFMWFFVARCPQAMISEKLKRGVPNDHSASWERWGLIGQFLKWVLLSLSLAVPLLQILWRLLDNSRIRGTLLITDAVIEIIVSVLYIFKLFLTISLIPPDNYWKVTRDYVPIIAALMLSAAIPIGNLTNIKKLRGESVFSDSTVGRFLFAIELYILLLYTLIDTFYNDVHPSLSDFRQESTNPPVVMRDNIVKTQLPLVYGSGPLDQKIPTSPETIRKPRYYGQVFQPSSRISSRKHVVPKYIEEKPLPQPRPPSRIPVEMKDGPERSSIQSKALPQLPTEIDFTSDMVSVASSHISSSSSAFSRIMSHKQEVDRTIEELRMLSPRAERTASPNATRPSYIEVPRTSVSIRGSDTSRATRRDRISSNSHSNRYLDSASVSEISLSNFPVPPGDAVPFTPSPTLVAQRTIRKNRRQVRLNLMAINTRDAQDAFLSAPLASNLESIEGRPSGMTQYDVTSFIDNLSDLKNNYSSVSLVQNQTSGDAIQELKDTSASRPRLKPMLLSGSNIITERQPPEISDMPESYLPQPLPDVLEGPDGPEVVARDSRLRPLLLGTSTMSSSVGVQAGYTPRSKVLIGPRRRAGAINGPRPNIYPEREGL